VHPVVSQLLEHESRLFPSQLEALHEPQLVSVPGPQQSVGWPISLSMTGQELGHEIA